MSASIYRNVLTLAKVGVVAWSVVLVLWALLVVWIYPRWATPGSILRSIWTLCPSN